LTQVLGPLPQYQDPNVLVGYETADDAGVFRLDEERALVQTLDFFTPVVDDPYQFGAIAAANSLSDVYAMGGRPLTAMAITCFPEKALDLQTLTQIMSGGLEKLREAGVSLIGGHTVTDPEMKFGYSVTGMVHPQKIVRNSTAQTGDVLVLTKPLGLGILTSGIKFNKTSAAAAQKAVTVMTTLNKAAAEVMLRHRCHAATDITGNGLLGHAFEMAEGSNVTIHFDAWSVPILDEAYALAESGLLPRSIRTTWKMIGQHTQVGAGVTEALKNILLDPQTSGGLLIAVADQHLESLMSEMQQLNIPAAVVGKVENPGGKRILVD
jgi:selenide,water dikinase